MTHDFIITNSGSTSKYKYIELKCSICNLEGFTDPLENYIPPRIYLYSRRNNICKILFGQMLSPDYITCEEFIIKNIIE